MTLQRYRSSLKRWSLSRTPATDADGGCDERQRLPTVKVTAASGDRDAESDANPVAVVGNGGKESASNGKTTKPEDAKANGPSVEETAFTGDKHDGSHEHTPAPAPGGSDSDRPDAEAEVAGTAAAGDVVAKNNDDAPASASAAADPALLMVSSSRDPSASFRLRRRRVQVGDSDVTNLVFAVIYYGWVGWPFLYFILFPLSGCELERGNKRLMMAASYFPQRLSTTVH